MDDDEFARRRQAFGGAVDDYDRIRPTYPADAVRWAVGGADVPLRVCDLGAGTGRLTGVLLAAGHRVVAVEPDPTMLARLVEHHGDEGRLDPRQGSAEDLPLDDGSVDAVVAAQAWHWFDPVAVLPEVARVLRPGGTVAAVWNSRDESVGWVAEWSRIAEEAAHPTGRKALGAAGGPDFGDAFEAREDAAFHHVQRLAPDDLVTLAASRSWTIALPPPRRDALLAAVAELARTHRDLAGRDVVELPYAVECFRARRR